MTDLYLQALAICDSAAHRLQAWCKAGALETSCPDQVGLSTRRTCEVWDGGGAECPELWETEEGWHALAGMRADLWGRGLACQEEICGLSPADEWV